MAASIGWLLLRAGLIDEAGLQAALQLQQRSGQRLASACLELGLADEAELARQLAHQQGHPYVVLGLSRPAAAAAGSLPAALCRLLPALPLRQRDGVLEVAVERPYDPAVSGELALATGAHIVEYGALAGPLRALAAAAGAERADATADGTAGEAAADGDARLELVGPPVPAVAAPSPAAEAEPPMEGLVDPAPAGEEQPDSGPIQVLVVEDDPAIQRMLAQFLEHEGYGVTTAADGRAAARQLRAGLPHAFVLDAMLPCLHGFDLCHLLKFSPTTQQLPVIMISAVHRGRQVRQQVKLTHGANAYLEKPIRLAELRQVLANCLSERPRPPSRLAVSQQLTALLRQGAAAGEAGDRAAVRRALLAAVEVAPFLPALRYRLARLQLQADQRYQALGHLEWAARLEPDKRICDLLARTYERVGFTRKAIAAWRSCAERCADSRQRSAAEQRAASLQQMLDD